MNKTERFVNQATSGRWLLTVIAGVCLFALTLTDCWAVYHGKAPPISVEAIFSVIVMVFMSYFNKPKEDANGNGSGEVVPSKPFSTMAKPPTP